MRFSRCTQPGFKAAGGGSPERRQADLQGHPVFIAQHATATCCRGCLAKWHGMRNGIMTSLKGPERQWFNKRPT